MKKELCFVAAAAVFVLGAGRAQAETVNWTCDFKGTYTETADKETTPFTWKVKWNETDGNMDKVTGTAEEKGGKSTTTGSCDDKTCNIDETYTDGPEKGKKFFWVGTYADNETDDENVYVTTIKGTYGSTAADRKSLGTWEAKANCKR